MPTVFVSRHVCRLVKMFGDLKSVVGVKALNDFLADNSYVEGYVPSQADTAVFGALKGAPPSSWPTHSDGRIISSPSGLG